MTIDHETRFAVHPDAAAAMGTEDLRRHFLIQDHFQPGRIRLTYTHYDRMIVGGAVPGADPLPLETIRPNGTARFLERRELVVVHVGGGAAEIRVGEESHALQPRDMLYVGMGQDVTFRSADAGDPARLYLLSAPAHRALPTRHLPHAAAKRMDLGARATANERSIFQYTTTIETCQIVVGMTQLAEGSVWNTMPAHIHDRRMEAYLYFDLPPEARVFHMMGAPDETRHIVMANEEAVVSPPWSIHSGCGTSAYAFVWAMAGDNVDYTDMDPAPLKDMR
ncbi:5-dehydro-4-deoxy-D-glucuronate isomerase [Aureimonas sp. Leaf324]|jgi:4-deoxy-L-threo-5-hexosulose-uronate ketol-isomerase|uniref:5-dehydro-4-deoxy-D-glucuronate isomerase n=1 Tax=Aureimonas sp. Leaf324 TaxID=1736336 RepID=UPI0006FBFE8E|nr:5-dehydro-4-deoxy-D-glucuronate isomerase [Aureimonas sp. Leaf324]KQQ81128.1 5-keto-4-deoxyuronate isomerase [Aureimonas sp. Leaf324]